MSRVLPKVLMLHRVLPQQLIGEPNAYADFGTLISQEYLEQILNLITDNGLKMVTVSDLATRLHAKANTDKLIALTFDDGYRDNFEFAVPSLKKFAATATFFPVVAPCTRRTVLPLDTYYQCVDAMRLTAQQRNAFIKGETKKVFYWTAPSQQLKMLKRLFAAIPPDMSTVASTATPTVGYMTPQQLQALGDNGFEIGSHGMTHSLLTADYMTEAAIVAELCDSKRELEKITGKPVIAYCLPAGEYNNRIIELVKQAGYTSVCLVDWKKNAPSPQPLTAFARVFVRPGGFDQLHAMLTA